ncbi:hypothetical protein TPB0596_00830 [Tsukamurella pulmonis]|nr:hypothetical protein TPB0596_00830 [Tsukamurella pulmonis]
MGSVTRAVEAAGWSGVVLPRTSVLGVSLFPVVAIDQAVWAERLTNNQPPEHDRSTLAVWESWFHELGDYPPRSPLTIVGFVSTAAQPQYALEALGRASGFGAGMWVTRAESPRSITLAEFDVADTWVVRERDSAVLVEGRPGPAATARRMTSTRHKEEQLFAWALNVGVGS